MRDKICGVYAIKSKDNRTYIGSSVDILKRWSEHKSRLKHNKHANPILTEIARKFGIEFLQLSILLKCSPDNLRLYEQLCIDSINPQLNVLQTATHYLTEQWKRSEFRKNNVARAKKLNAKLWRDPVFVEKARKRAKVMNTPESREKAIKNRNKSIAKRGQAYQNLIKTSSETFKKMHADPEFAKKHAERKRREMLERCKDKEFCARRDRAAAEANKKPILCVTTGEIFPSKNEAAKALGISVSLISKQIRGLPTRTNLKWKFVNG